MFNKILELYSSQEILEEQKTKTRAVFFYSRYVQINPGKIAQEPAMQEFSISYVSCCTLSMFVLRSSNSRPSIRRDSVDNPTNIRNFDTFLLFQGTFKLSIPFEALKVRRLLGFIDFVKILAFLC